MTDTAQTPTPTSEASATTAPWRPVLPPDLAARALAVAEEVGEALRGLPPPEPSELGFRDGPSLAGGDAGISLFFAQLERARPGAGWEDVGMERLERAVEGTAEMPLPPGLYSGFSGVAWSLEHLRGRLYEDAEDEDAGAAVAEALLEHTEGGAWRGHFDVISGLAGLGLYALERLPRPGGEEVLRKVVARLAETAERRPEGLVWRTVPELMPERDREVFPEGNFNLGVAHGQPGVLPVLARAQALGIDCRELLDGAVAWLLAQRLPPGNGGGYGYSVVPGGNAQQPQPARVAWCYGDLGIAAALLASARAVGEGSWEREALDLARGAAARGVEESGVKDAGLCHGAAGIAHLFNRLHQTTGDPVLGDAARRWIEVTLDMRRPGEGVAGFSSWYPDATQTFGWVPDPGFLTGSAGIALALLAAARSEEPEWDRVLGISAP